MLERDELPRFDYRLDFACFVLRRAGLECVVDRRQAWRVGGCELTVELARDESYRNVVFVRAGWPRSPDIRPRRSLCLAEVFAIAVTGQVRNFRGPELARFKQLALVEAEIVERPELRLPPLPADAPAVAVETWALIEELLRVRAVTGEPGPLVPLVSPWLASLNGTNEAVVRAGKRWLEQHGWITRAGEAPGRFGNPTILWAIKGLELPHEPGQERRR